MPFDTRPRAQNIAVIGGGISGMTAALSLAGQHRVTLIEAETRLGGHAHTVMAGKRGDQPVDMGFIVFNRVNYPGLCQLFETLDVPVAPSNMSFGCSIAGGKLEYGVAGLGALLAQPGNALKPQYLGMIRDILRFLKAADRVLRPEMTLDDLLKAIGTSDWFRDYFLTPFTGAIWSTPVTGILEFPAWPLIQFFKNHGLMGLGTEHQWYTVKGGSIEYVSRMQKALSDSGVTLRLGAAVQGLRRLDGGGVELRLQGGEWQRFDQVVMACHSDQSLALLAEGHSVEARALSAIRYQPNHAVLHADPSVMPKAKRAWSSWNYVEAAGTRPDRIALTYWMNLLQPIPKDDPLFVTLNPVLPIDPALVHKEVTFHHPVYDHGTLEAQRVLKARNGTGGLWFAGAWMRNGFHEDGLQSALDVVRAMQDQRERVAA